jgi:hypothetical protein
LHWFVACLAPGEANPEAAAPEAAAPEAAALEASASEASTMEASASEASADAVLGSEASVQEASVPEGAAEDASIQDNSGFASAVPQMPGTFTVLFDGVPAQSCVCTANNEITCARVLPTVETIGFRYVQSPAPLADGGPEAGADGGTDGGSDGGQASIVLSIDFDVGDCLPSHTGCPHSDVPEGSAY